MNRLSFEERKQEREKARGQEESSLLSERREDLVAERTRAFKAACTDSSCGTSRSRLGVAGTLSDPLAARILRGIRPQGSLSPHPLAVGFGDHGRHPDA
jgi:hypothetical protein